MAKKIDYRKPGGVINIQQGRGGIIPTYPETAGYPLFEQRNIDSIVDNGFRFRYELDRSGRIVYAVYPKGYIYVVNDIASGVGSTVNGAIEGITANTLSSLNFSTLQSGTEYDFVAYSQVDASSTKSPLIIIPVKTKGTNDVGADTGIYADVYSDVYA